MTEPEAQVFRLVARPPVRPLALAAALTVAGAGSLVLGAVADTLFWVLAGAILLGLGLGLALLAGLFWRRLRAEVTLDSDGITVRRGRRLRFLSWSEVAEVRATPFRLTLVPKQSGRALAVVNPQRATAPVFAALADAVRVRMDADRGYRTMT